MTTQQASIQYPKKSNENNFAIFFFFLGAPHIYSFLKRRSQKKEQSIHISSVVGYGLMTIGITGTFALLSF